MKVGDEIFYWNAILEKIDKAKIINKIRGGWSVIRIDGPMQIPFNIYYYEDIFGLDREAVKEKLIEEFTSLIDKLEKS